MKSNPDYVFMAGGVQRGIPGIATWETADTAVPTTTETVTIGADIYEWYPNGGAPGGNTPVEIGATTAISYGNLAVAINTLGTELLLATDTATEVQIIPAIAVGGTGTEGQLPTVAGSVDAWKLWVDGNSRGLAMSTGMITFNADNVAAAFAVMTPPAASGMVLWKLFTGAGVEKATSMTVGSAVGGSFDIDPTAGGVPPVATDYMVFVVFAIG